MFLLTKNLDDCETLIPIRSIGEVILYDKDDELKDDLVYSILIFSNEESTSIAREDFYTPDEARKRFAEIYRQLAG